MKINQVPKYQFERQALSHPSLKEFVGLHRGSDSLLIFPHKGEWQFGGSKHEPGLNVLSVNGFGAYVPDLFDRHRVSTGVVDLEKFDENGFRNQYTRFDSPEGLPFYSISVLNDGEGRELERKTYSLEHFGGNGRGAGRTGRVILTTHSFINFEESDPVGYTSIGYSDYRETGVDEVIVGDFNSDLAVVNGTHWMINVFPGRGEMYNRESFSELQKEFNNNGSDYSRKHPFFKVPLHGWNG